jgi:hypothetical protein
MKPDDPILEKILEGQEMPLVKIKDVVNFFDKKGITDFVFALGFKAANFVVIPAEAVVKTKRAPKCLIDGRYVYANQQDKTDFKTIDEIITRINRWLDIWPQIRSNHQWTPTIIAKVANKGFVWCNSSNQSVTDNMIEFYENGIPEHYGKEGAIDVE